MSAIRFTGISSGLDIQAIISGLMAVERRPVVLMTQRRNSFSARLDAWRDLRAKLDTLQSKVEALNKLDTFQARTASVLDSSLFDASASSGAPVGSYEVEVLALAQKHVVQLSPAATMSSPDAQFGGSGELTIEAKDANGNTVTKTITIDPGTGSNDTLNKIAATIDGWSDVQLDARVVEVSPGDYELMIEETRTGAAYSFLVAQTGANFDAPQTVQTAQDAQVKVDGVTFTRTTNSISGVIDGVDLTLKKVGGPTTLTISEDQDTAVNAVREFVDAYNAFVNAVSNYTKYDTEKKTAGVLLGETGLSNLLSGLRTRLVSTVPGVAEEVNSLTMIGVTTDYQTGNLILDEGKLRDKLTDFAADVKALFQTAGDGIAVKADSFLDQWTQSTGLIAETEKSLEKQVDHLQERIDFWEEVVLPKREATLLAQFTRMEQLLGQFQAQGQWLSSQLAGF